MWLILQLFYDSLVNYRNILPSKALVWVSSLSAQRKYNCIEEVGLEMSKTSAGCFLIIFFQSQAFGYDPLDFLAHSVAKKYLQPGDPDPIGTTSFGTSHFPVRRSDRAHSRLPRFPVFAFLIGNVFVATFVSKMTASGSPEVTFISVDRTASSRTGEREKWFEKCTKRKRNFETFPVRINFSFSFMNCPC